MKEFKEGDLVESPRFGKGVIVGVLDYLLYPVYVEFPKSNPENTYGDIIQRYTKDGRWGIFDEQPSLKHIETPSEEA